MTTINLNQVGTFVRVVESGTFTAAATALGLPKSSISRGVAALEEALGVRLLQRTTRKLNLTEAGRQYFQQVRAALAGLDQANATIAEIGSEPRGTVRVTAPADFGEGLFSEIISAFITRYPRIQLDVVLTGRRVNLIEEGFDLAVRAGKLEDSTLVARKVASTALGLFAAPSYLQRRGRPKRFADLAKHDCVLHRSARGVFPWRLTGPRGPELVTVLGAAIADSFDFVRGLVKGGVGIGLLPELGLAGEVARGALVRVLPAYALRGGALYVVTPPLRHVPARVALLRAHLIDELSARMAGLP
jgi:DNA-binding transcriptional LysR family regulator